MSEANGNSLHSLVGLSVVSLADLTGNMVKPWAEAGWTCYCVDIQHSIRRDRVEGNIHYVWGDVRSWTPPTRPAIIFGFTPCTHLCGSGARDWKKKDWPMLRDGMDLFHAARMAAEWAGCPWMLENPVGRISGLHGASQHRFHPWQYGDGYQKQTCLWTGGGFVMPPPTVQEKPADCDQRIWTCPPSEDRADIRSATPMGFARAVYRANSLLDRNNPPNTKEGTPDHE
jgi:hypothetical protein